MLVEISERGPRDGLKTNAPGEGTRLRFPRGKLTGPTAEMRGAARPSPGIEVDEYEYTGRKNEMGQPIFAPVGDRERQRKKK
jgi:hypothetical protein